MTSEVYKEEYAKAIENENNIILNPWIAKGQFNDEVYNKLVEEFGMERLSNELLERFEKVTGHKPHMWMRRNIFFAHREFNLILDDYEQGKPIFLYTGRGPSGKNSLHLGHIISYYFTAWLQKVFNALVVIQIADDEKFYFKDQEWEEI